jgi:HK97 family phage major capsid protein
MATIPEMRARLAEIKERLEAIHSEFGERALDEERQTEWDTLDAEYDEISANLDAAEKRAESLAKKVLSEPKTTERGSDSGPAFIKKKTEQELYDLGELRSMSYSGDDFLNKVTDNAKHAIERGEYGVAAKDKEAAQERAFDLLESVDNGSRDLAKRYLLTGSSDYERAFAKVMRHGSDAFCTAEERQALLRAQSLGSDSGGGYAVPFQLDPTVILTSAGVVNPIRELARVEQIVGKEWQGVTTAGTSVSRDAEAEEVSDDSFTLGQPVVRTKRVQGFVPFSIEIDLSWSALRREITTVLVDAKEAEEDSFITGDATGNLPEGINAGLVGTGNDISTATSAAFTAADIYAVEEALAPRWERNASFLAHKSVYNKIRQFATDGNTGSMNNLFVERITQGTPRQLLDYPSYRSSALPTIATAQATSAATADATLMLFGDFRQFLIVDRIGMTVEMIPHLFGAAGRRPTGQRGVYAVWMNNSKILVPGAFKRLIDKV